MPISFREQAPQPERASMTPGKHAMKVHDVREGTWPSGDAYVEVCCKVEDGNWLNARIKPTLLEIGRVYVACGLDRPTGDAFDESDLDESFHCSGRR